MKKLEKNRSWVWNRVITAEDKVKTGKNMVFMLGSDNDPLNLQTAMWLRNKYSESYINVRMLHSSKFASRLQEELNLNIIQTSEELIHNIESWLLELQLGIRNK